MKNFSLLILLLLAGNLAAQNFQVASPDGNIRMELHYADKLSYTVTFKGNMLISPSPLGFEFKGEEPMQGGMQLLNHPQVTKAEESWVPVVKNKHENIRLAWNETTLTFRESKGDMRRMDIAVRVYNNGLAFRYQLYGGRNRATGR